MHPAAGSAPGLNADRPVFKLTLGDRHFASSRPLLMGVVNVTPDSFFDGGRFASHAAAVAQAFSLAEAGADIVDLGAESTRPGAPAVSPEQELERLIPVLDGVRGISAALSVDTRHAETMREVIARGVNLINDVNALRAPGAIDAVAASKVGVCLMHMRGEPQTMQRAPVYDDVLDEVTQFLSSAVQRAVAAGIAPERLLVDPGIGFGKTLQHNLVLLRGIATIARTTRTPVLIGLSRKSMLGEITGRAVEARLAASLGGALAAMVSGAAVLRVHDVAETRDAIAVYSAMMADGQWLDDSRC